mgnify:CR=1 FL=1
MSINVYMTDHDQISIPHVDLRFWCESLVGVLDCEMSVNHKKKRAEALINQPS